jgi:hypothetical protein
MIPAGSVARIGLRRVRVRDCRTPVTPVVFRTVVVVIVVAETEVAPNAPDHRGRGIPPGVIISHIDYRRLHVTDISSVKMFNVSNCFCGRRSRNGFIIYILIRVTAADKQRRERKKNSCGSHILPPLANCFFQ